MATTRMFLPLSVASCLPGLLGMAALVAAGQACSSSSGGTTASDGGNEAGSTEDSSTAEASAPDSSATDGAATPEAGTDAGTDAGAAVATNVLYTLSNNITAGQNAVLAYARAADGSLTPLAGGPFMTGGTGVSNPTQSLGPDDSDDELIASPDHTRLFAVNAGSNTIAVFDIHGDGSLTAVAGSPFPSGGISPVSVGLSGNFLYVVNQDEDTLQDAAAGSPSYTAFTVAASGALTPVANSTVAAGVSPSVAYVSPSGKLLFGSDFLAPLKSNPPQGPLRAFAINADGTLTPAPGTPMAIPVVDGGSPPGTPVALGIWSHPTQNILYVDFTLRSQVGVYTYDPASGALTYVTEAPVSGAAPCWVRASANGNFLYVTDTANDSVSVLDSSNPMAPTEIQNLVLQDAGALLSDAAPFPTTSESYEENLSPDGKFLYVLSQRTTPNVADSSGNVLHALSIGSNGMLTETVAPVSLTLPLGTRPQGVVVF